MANSVNAGLGKLIMRKLKSATAAILGTLIFGLGAIQTDAVAAQSSSRGAITAPTAADPVLAVQNAGASARTSRGYQQALARGDVAGLRAILIQNGAPDGIEVARQAPAAGPTTTDFSIIICYTPTGGVKRCWELGPYGVGEVAPLN